MRAKCWAKEIVEHKKWHAETYGAPWWQVERLDWIGNRVRTFAQANGVTNVFVEGYAFGSQNAREALAELGGVVKHDLYTMHLLVTPIVAASARKTLLGKVPSKKTSGIAVKDYVNEKLARMGAKFDTMDEGDAYIIANAGRAALGLDRQYAGIETNRE